MIYCDNCGSENADNWISELPVGVDSANAGESAVLCDTCYRAILPELEGWILPRS